MAKQSNADDKWKKLAGGDDKKAKKAYDKAVDLFSKWQMGQAKKSNKPLASTATFTTDYQGWVTMRVIQDRVYVTETDLCKIFYKMSGNPFFVWKAIRLVDRGDKLPSWIFDYLLESSANLLTIGEKNSLGFRSNSSKSDFNDYITLHEKFKRYQAVQKALLDEERLSNKEAAEKAKAKFAKQGQNLKRETIEKDHRYFRKKLQKNNLTNKERLQFLGSLKVTFDLYPSR